MEPLCVDVRSACKLVGIGKTKLYQLIAQNKLERRKIDGKTVITLRSIRALVDCC